ncbi:hypothetical protein AAH979_06425 [Plantactinospora sp. ZYX-F-223]|uniref:hypothetical protein n=1 Tax=Plantactinospora sp. ZYX-F-223 TaxID=3144103 RepID=UPI0031FE37C8
MPVRESFVRVVLIGAITFGLGGCTDDGPSAPQQEPAIAVISVPDLKSLALPLDAYLPTREQAAVLLTAENNLKLECLRRFGFALSVPAAQPRPLAVNERRYGVTSEEDVASYGYRVPPEYVVERQKEPELSAAALSILTGDGQNSYQGQAIPEGGCTGEARRKIAGGAATPADPDVAQNLKAEALSRARHDSRMVAIFAEWKACMARSGYDYSDPFDANDDAQFASGESASDAEISTASADVRCKKDTNLVNVWVAVDVAYQNRAIEQHSEALNTAKQLLETRLRNAAKVVGT